MRLGWEIEAVHSGHEAAESIIRYLSGNQLERKPKPPLPVVHLEQSEIESRLAKGEIRIQGRIQLPELTLCWRMN